MQVLNIKWGNKNKPDKSTYCCTSKDSDKCYVVKILPKAIEMSVLNFLEVYAREITKYRIVTLNINTYS